MDKKYKNLGIGLMFVLGLCAPRHVMAQPAGAPIDITVPTPVPDALPKPVDMIPMPAALGQDSPPEGYAAAVAEANGQPLPPQTEPSPASQNADNTPADIDLAAQCRETNASASAVSACLRTIRHDLDDSLKKAEMEALQKSSVATDWKQSHYNAQRLANSSMSFDAYRTSECLRRHDGEIQDQNPQTDDYVSCEIQMTQSRIKALQN